MSTEQPFDPQLIEQTKQQIQKLVREIAQLTKDQVSPGEFYGEFLPRVVQALAAIGGAVWATDENGRLGLQYQVNLEATKLRENEEGQAQHGRLLYKCLGGDSGILVPPHSGVSEDDDEAANPTDVLLVLGPLKADEDTVGVLEIIQRAEAGPATQQGYLRFAMQMCELAGDYLKSHKLRDFGGREALWTLLEGFSHDVHMQLDPRETAYTIANEGRRLIECDRVSVAIRHGNKCKIEAVSGQDIFDKRSNTVRLLGKLATAVVATGDSVWYAGDTRDMAPQVEDAVQEYVDESHSKNVAVLPLRRPEMVEEDDPDKREAPAEPIGALIVEQIEDSRVPETMVQRVDVVCRHSSIALANALEHQSLFLMPLWRAIGKAKWVLRARTLPKTLAILGLILAALLWLILWPTDFVMDCKGTLEPITRQDVFAPANAKVIELLVKHGQFVEGGKTVLARLEDDTLRKQMIDVQGQLAATGEQISAKGRELGDRDLSRIETERIKGELQALLERAKSLRDQMKILKKQERDLDIVSPISGRVLSWDLEDRLRLAPVNLGQFLLRIADPNGDWELNLDMPDTQMGHIARFRNELPDGEKQDVTFILATDPGIEHEGTVREIARIAEVEGEEGNMVQIKVDFKKAELLAALMAAEGDRTPHLRPGAEVNAEVHCGRCSIGYSVFHKAFEFVQSRIIFPYF